MLRSIFLATLLSTSLLLCLGCGEAKRQTAHLSGKVTFKGQPVPEGFINFMPDITGGNSGEVRGFSITNGTYDTRQGSSPGIFPGKNKVMISGFNGKAKNLWPKGEQIFNPIELNLEVADGTNTKDFEVPESAGQNVRIVPTADPN